MEITGTISSIEYFSSPEKSLVTIKPDKHQTAYIEFRGKRSKKTIGFADGDNVSVTVDYDGRRSKTTGKPYNNLVGRKITKN